MVQSQTCLIFVLLLVLLIPFMVSINTESKVVIYLEIKGEIAQKLASESVTALDNYCKWIIRGCTKSFNERGVKCMKVFAVAYKNTLMKKH